MNNYKDEADYKKQIRFLDTYMLLLRHHFGREKVNELGRAAYKLIYGDQKLRVEGPCDSKLRCTIIFHALCDEGEPT